MITAIVQARLSSTRLPGKALLPLGDSVVLHQVLRRVERANKIDNIVTAITEESSDDPLEQWLRAHNYKVFRGSTDDVLDRFYQAASFHSASIVVRITADDPLKDPDIIDQAINTLTTHKLDYVSNTIEPSFPEGLDIEVFTFKALEQAWSSARLPSEREHVTPFIWKNRDKFKTSNFTFEENLQSWRWTLDYTADYEFLKIIYAEFQGKMFGYRDVIKYLKENPEIVVLNQNTVRNEGYLNSLKSEGISKDGPV